MHLKSIKKTGGAIAMLALLGGCVAPYTQADSEQAESEVERNRKAAAQYGADSAGGGGNGSSSGGGGGGGSGGGGGGGWSG